MKSSIKDKIEGKMHQVKGKVKETIGKAFKNNDLKAEGTVEKVNGKTQEKIGGFKKVAGK